MQINKLKKSIAFFGDDYRLKNDFFIHHLKNGPLSILVEYLNKDFNIHTLDYFKNERPNACIFLDIPKVEIKKLIDINYTKSIVILREPETINKRNFDQNFLKQFQIILTWKENFIDNKKYYYIPPAKFNIKKKVEVFNPFDRKLCVLINSNLKSQIKGELYSERLRLIKFYEKNHLSQFDLYGYNWDKIDLKLFKIKLPYPVRKSYKGTTKNKHQTLSNYKFSVCFENTNNVNYYTSEKIFDCFLSNTIPIYYGAPNIHEIIPTDTFIDYRNFKNLEELHEYINNMRESEYLDYIKKINLLFNDQKIEKFSINNWYNSIIKVINLI